MTTLYVLVDYENVQPRDLALLKGQACKVLVFVGKHQKLTVDCANALQPLGEMGEYIQINGSGRNALDFHLAFHLGALAARAPDATLCVLSKDKGFDLLIDHLNARGVKALRCLDVKGALEHAVDGRDGLLLARIIADLEKRGDKRPKTERTLVRALVARFPAELTLDAAQACVEALRERAVIAGDKGRLTYKL